LDGVMFCSFFFSSRRRHTRFSRDWSSDVCSSDLLGDQRASRIDGVEPPLTGRLADLWRHPVGREQQRATRRDLLKGVDKYRALRSEERRVGKECRARRSTEHCKKQTKSEGEGKTV